MAEQVNTCLLHRHKHLRLNPQIQVKIQAQESVPITSALRDGGPQILGAPWTDLAEREVPGWARDSILKIRWVRYLKKYANPCLSQAHSACTHTGSHRLTCTCTHAHIHAWAHTRLRTSGIEPRSSPLSCPPSPPLSTTLFCLSLLFNKAFLFLFKQHSISFLDDISWCSS